MINIKPILARSDFGFVQRSEAIAESLRNDRDVINSIQQLLLDRFRKEVSKTSPYDIQETSMYRQGSYRSVLPVPQSVIRGSALIRHLKRSVRGNQNSAQADLIDEHAGYNLFNVLGFDTPSFLIGLNHPSFIDVFGLKPPRPIDYHCSSLPPLTLYEIVRESQLTEDLSDEGELEVEEVGGSARWLTDDNFTRQLTGHFEAVDKKLSGYGASLLIKEPALRERYRIYSEITYVCVGRGGKIERIVFGDLQNFYDSLSSLNSHDSIDRMPCRLGYDSKERPPRVSLE